MHFLGIRSFFFFGYPHTLVGKVLVLYPSYILILFIYISWWTSVHRKYKEVWAWYLGETFESGKDTNRHPRRLSSKESARNAGETEDSDCIQGQEDPLEEGMVTHYSILAQKIPWTEEPGGLQSMELQRIGCDWSEWAPHSTKRQTAIWDFTSVQLLNRVRLFATPWIAARLVLSRKKKKVMKVLVTQSFLIFCHPVDCNPPGSSAHGILPARILKRVAVPFSRGSFRPRDWTQVTCIAGRFFTI